jgi:hypothetical protein
MFRPQLCAVIPGGSLAYRATQHCNCAEAVRVPIAVVWAHDFLQCKLDPLEYDVDGSPNLVVQVQNPIAGRDTVLLPRSPCGSRRPACLRMTPLQPSGLSDLLSDTLNLPSASCHRLSLLGHHLWGPPEHPPGADPGQSSPNSPCEHGIHRNSRCIQNPCVFAGAYQKLQGYTPAARAGV